MPSATRRRRGASTKHLDLLGNLRRLLRAPVDPERMLRSVAELLAVEIGQYCAVDLIDRRGSLRRLTIQHADESRQARLRIACDDARFPAGGRVSQLLEHGGCELVARVGQPARAGRLSDLVLLREDEVKSYMAAAVLVDGAPMAVLTLVATHGTRRYDDEERALLEQVADFTGLGVENALRREAQPRASIAPPRAGEAPASLARVPRHG